MVNVSIYIRYSEIIDICSLLLPSLECLMPGEGIDTEKLMGHLNIKLQSNNNKQQSRFLQDDRHEEEDGLWL